MKRVLVTGGAGLIGRAVVEQLATGRDWDVTVLDDFRVGGQTFAPPSGPRIHFQRGDGCDAVTVDAVVQGQDAVIHLAAPSSFLMYEEDATGSTVGTVHTFLNILEAMRRHRVRKLVYASTSAVYEGNQVPWDEAMPIRPPDLKALSKKFCEEMAMQYSDRYGMTCIGFRPLSVYGAREAAKGGYANVISLFTWAMAAGHAPVVWGDGSQTRDFIYVDDAARAFCAALNADIPTDILNLGTGVETSFLEVIEHIAQALGRAPLAPQFVPVPIAIYAQRILGDPRKCQSVLGFTPTISVAEGVRRILQAEKEPAALAHHQLYALPRREVAQ